jgi:nitrogen fixation NifU-like protein
MDIYRENILDHYKHPKNFGRLTRVTATAADAVVSCGDSMTMEIFVENEIVTEIGFTGSGCAISMASASLLTDHAKGKSIRDLQRLDKDAILQLLGITLTPTRLKCALLSLEVLHKVLNQVNSK